MKGKMRFKEPNKIEFDDKSWNYILKLSGSKAKTLNGQRKAVRKLIHSIFNTYIDELKKEKKCV